jgi:aryl-alcohol dehydrogenase-like predicted oxidoreductase
VPIYSQYISQLVIGYFLSMLYRYLGPTGIKISVIGYGNWINSNSEDAQQLTTDCVKTAWDQGINFFDTAELYGMLNLIQALEKLNDSWEKL